MISSSLKKVFIALAISALISSTEGQSIPTCSSKSFQCCWVVRIWRLMGQNTNVSSTSPTGCCDRTWGVTCSGNTVTQLSWSGKGLKGPIPSDIGNLKNLIFLSLSRNEFNGPIPSSIGNLVNLYMLYLSTAKLTGSIPTTIGKLTKLQNIHLFDNQMTGPIPPEFGDAVNLRLVHLDHNNFTGPLPSTIGKLVNLRELISGNQLTGPIPSTIGSWGLLQKLNLKKNNLSGSLPSTIGNLGSLLHLDISGNQLTGAIPSTIGNLINLQILEAHFNKLSGPIPASFGNLNNLQKVDLQFNQLAGPMPPMGHLPILNNLNFQNNPGLTGPFSPKCGAKVVSLNTAIILCGCSTSTSPAFIFPPPSTPPDCLSSGPSSPLSKRILAFSQNVGTLRFTCYTDENSNPYQDCINSMAYLCNSAYLGTDAGRIANCKTAVDTMTNGLNPHWQKVRRECGAWSLNGLKGDFASSNCLNANSGLREKAYYLYGDRERAYVTPQLTESVRLGLWNNPLLRE